MKIQYESTIEEAVYSQMRLLEVSKVLRKWKWQGLLAAPILGALFYTFIPSDQGTKMMFAFFIPIIFLLQYPFTFKSNIRRKVRRALIKQLGTDDPIPCEYEVTDEGIIFKKQGTEIKFPWSKLTAINNTKEYIELIFENVGISLIPKHALQEVQVKGLFDFINNKTTII